MKKKVPVNKFGSGNCCPECGSTMNFFGGDDVPFGDAVWKCPDCKFQFSENDLNEYDVFIY